ncbi:DUF1176 domain-containing protein [Stenotrophomonas maltophilia]|uniref:DUF1176 domain-containing protein n=1 Tax=Stenotrophomonas maltophilia TaxID=40324 RepID=UPI003CCFE0DA
MHRPLSALIVGLLLPLASHAGNTLVTPGIEFVHHDWFLACDNTGTCRAAGYGPENADSLLSLMLERAGGPGTAVKARLRVGEDGESAMPEGALRLQVNGRDLGPVQDTGADEAVALRPAQVEALLAALPGQARIEVIDSNRTRWPVSDRGAAAVLLKMDEAQGRIGTPGALVRRGTRAETTVPAARAKPVIASAALAAPRSGDSGLGSSEALRDALIATLGDSDDCPRLIEYTGTPEMVIERLDEHHVLVQALCQMGAYNYSNGFWIARDRPRSPRRRSRWKQRASRASNARSTRATRAAASATAFPARTGYGMARDSSPAVRSVPACAVACRAGTGCCQPCSVRCVECMHLHCHARRCCLRR